MYRFPVLTLFLLIPLVFQAATHTSLPSVTVVPKPLSVVSKPGVFVINDQTTLLVSPGDQEMVKIARLFADQLNIAGGPDLRVREMTANDRNLNAVIFTRTKGNSAPAAEGYSLKATP
ncbi:MAG: glycoside hydrolase family 20 zincin-like fold domain-containing protein, partial [Bacteroidota bacterium]